MKSYLNFKFITVLLVFITLAFFVGRMTGPQDTATTSESGHDHVQDETESWTCSMHPQFNLPDKGQCPICFMDLIPAERSSDDNPLQLKLSPSAVKLADIQTVKAKRKAAVAELLLSGSVDYDETRIGKITAWVPGRLEHLYVDFTGIRVSEGDHMVELYSPDLVAAQEELLQSQRYLDSIQDKSGQLYQSANSTLSATKEKLRLLGFGNEQLEQVLTSGEYQESVTIYSPVSGIVIHKDAVEGMYVKTGTPIYTIADLSRVWIILDAYESDLPWLKYGQDVSITAEALPGEIFSGKIAFIDPILDARTRTVKVRINVENTQQLLKPGMFIRAEVQSILDADGNSINPDLAGKWISPMHPEVIKDQAGSCDVCGMPLVPAEELGIVSMPAKNDLPLVVPVSAVLRTGKRAILYIRLPDTDEPTFEGREVVLGTRAGDSYIIREGLMAGEEVVVNGNFKIDSAMQLASKPSMMNPEGGRTSTGHEGHNMDGMQQSGGNMAGSQEDEIPLIISTDLANEVLTPYLELQSELANDDYDKAYQALMKIHNLTMGVPGAEAIMEPTMRPIQNITQLRAAFEDLSTAMQIAVEKGLISESVNKAFCPMAFDNRGAYWLQKGDVINNPYFGSQMLRCGVIKQSWPSTESGQ